MCDLHPVHSFRCPQRPEKRSRRLPTSLLFQSSPYSFPESLILIFAMTNFSDFFQCILKEKKENNKNRRKKAKGKGKGRNV